MTAQLEKVGSHELTMWNVSLVMAPRRNTSLSSNSSQETPMVDDLSYASLVTGRRVNSARSGENSNPPRRCSGPFHESSLCMGWYCN